MQGSQDIPKYLKSAFMQPEAFVIDMDGIKKHVQEFILDIPDGVFDLFVQTYTSTSDECNSCAKMMMDACNYPIRQRNIKLQKKISEVSDPIEDTPFSEPKCVQQTNNDFLFFCMLLYEMYHETTSSTTKKRCVKEDSE
ncbi:hypothetical protein MKX01_014903 [Papaver californicum]|nr:hypothetical protein MKX01_014903 [Papaver californicum]